MAEPENSSTATVRQRRPWRELVWLVVLTAGAAGAVAGMHHLRQPLKSEVFFVEAAPPIPVERVRLAPPSAGLAEKKSFPAHFLLLHGYAANRRQLLHLAQVLAVSGGDVYLMDMPGRGDHSGRASPLPEGGPTAALPTPRENEAALAVVHHLERDFGVGRERLILVGHSTGGGVAIDVARRVLPAATVVLSGLERPVAPGQPPNLLLVTARLDYPPLSEAAERMFEQSRAGMPAGVGGAGRREFLTWHSSLPYHASVQQAILEWTREAVPGAELRAPQHFNLWLWGLTGAAVILAGALIWPLARLAARWLAYAPLGEVVPESRLALWTPARLAGFPLLCGAVVGLGQAGAERLRLPTLLGFLRLSEGDTIASAFLLSLLGILVVQRRLPWVRSSRETAAKTVGAVGLAAYVVLVCGALVTWQVYDAWPTLGRLARFPVLLAAFLPYAFGEELLLRSYSPPGADRELSGLLLWRAPLLLAVAGGAELVGSGGGLLLVVTVPLLALSVVEHLLAATLRSALESVYAVAVFRGILLAWVFAAAFALR